MSKVFSNFGLADARYELLQLPKQKIALWVVCFIASLVLLALAFMAKNATEAALRTSTTGDAIGVVSSEGNRAGNSSDTLNAQATSSNATESGASEQAAEVAELNGVEELVLLDELVRPDNEGLRRISTAALTLHSRLQQSTEAAASHASSAGRVAGLAIAMRQEQLANNNESFWQPMSESIAELEQAVRLGEVADASASELVTELRAHYVDLRLKQSASGGSDEPTNLSASIDVDEPAAQVTDSTQVAISRSTNTVAALPLPLRLLPWLLALLPLACLAYAFFALKNLVNLRHQQQPKVGYAQVASAEQALHMTESTSLSNPHAAERQTQAAILQLLDEMEPLSEGDLTHEASVTEDLTGALADAFNQAVQELRRLVLQINQSSGQVRSAVSQSRERSLSMARQGAVQAREVTRTHQRLEQMKGDVQSLSTNTQQVAAYAHDVAHRTQQAANAVARSTQALASMRAQADTAERSMRRLVSSTQGIESRLADIQSASNRTDLLALNSTIYAASCGSTAEMVPVGRHSESAANYAAGNSSSGSSAQNFAELATDVSSLATQLSNATRDIDQLSVVIQDEAKDSLDAMRATVSQVEVTEKLSRDAQHHLEEIAAAATALGASVAEIADRTEQQAEGVSDVAKTTRVINDITHDTAKALSQAVEDLHQLENLSSSLEASVHGFRLPSELTT